jgi:hypothetical protein
MKCDRFIGTGTRQQPMYSELRRLSGSRNNIKRFKRHPLQQKPRVLRNESILDTSVRHDPVTNITSVISHIYDDDETKVQIQEQDNEASNRKPDNNICRKTLMIVREHVEHNDCLDGDRETNVEINYDIISTTREKTKVN